MTDWPDRLPTTKDGETIFILRSELQEARQEIERLRAENNRIRDLIEVLYYESGQGAALEPGNG